MSDDAKTKAWRRAILLAQGDRGIAAAVSHNAELVVIRRLLASTLPGGESEYWDLVAKEIDS